MWFFFQAEDGIRDIGVTGVQTCALPILGEQGVELRGARGDRPGDRRRTGVVLGQSHIPRGSGHRECDAGTRLAVRANSAEPSAPLRRLPLDRPHTEESPMRPIRLAAASALLLGTLAPVASAGSAPALAGETVITATRTAKMRVT